MKYISLCFSALFLLVWSCKRESFEIKQEQSVNGDLENTKKKDTILFNIMNPLQTGIKFINNITETPDMNGFMYEYYYNGAGVSIADIDNDGLQDLLFISSLGDNKLYLNQGDLNFKDITIESGLNLSKGFRTGVTNVDINNDGLMDFYISKSGKYNDYEKIKNELWINQGKNHEGIPHFKEEASRYNLDIAMCSTQAAFFDYDLDGDLDMFLINHYTSPPSYQNIDQLIGTKGLVTGDRLLENRNGKYIDVTLKSGITNINRLSYGLGLSIGDLNNDGWPDVYVSNDYEGKDFLYLNNGNGTFKDVANTATNHVSFYSMGTDIADVNNDGLLDFMSLDMMAENNYDIKTSMSSMNTEKFYDVVHKGLHHQYMYNALQINNGITALGKIPVFSDVAQLSGIASTDWSWGPLFFDMDNDGYKDLFVSNGIKRDFRNNDFLIKQKSRKDIIKAEDRDAFMMEVIKEMPERKRQNYFYKNNGDLSFTKKNEKWIIDIPGSSNGAAYGDLDNDGDMDIVVNNVDNVSLIYKNNASELGLGNFLKFKFKGSNNNIHGIGAHIKIIYQGKVQVQEHHLTRGFQSAIGTGIHFGLGNIENVDTIVVTWPGGKQQQLENIRVNQTIELNYEEASKLGIKHKSHFLFNSMDNETLGIKWQHKENNFNDFERESLLPHKMSQFGPAIAVADFDGDKLDDIYMGGALGQAPVLFKQTSDGTFQIVQKEFFDQEKKYEDVDALFVDVDNDGDLDLYVVSGGNENAIGSSNYMDRLYENKDGQFIRNTNALPVFNSSGSVVRAFDYDNDGDLDLFVGGRQYPGKYPTPVSSYLLRNNSQNNNIKFTIENASIFPTLENIGMVSDALVIDFDKDQRQDLILVGEWMSIRAFRNTGHGFDEVSDKLGFKNTTGWWNTIKAADFDDDGDLDLVIGNLGQNYKYKASKEKPFKIYANDFDSNGTFDIVLGFYEGTNLYPLRGRQCSSQQMPFIKEKFKTYHEFGNASLEEVYSKELLYASINYEAQIFSNTYYENIKGKFIPHLLPNEAQITSVNDILIEDYNHDGYLDMIIAGNLYGSEVETPRNDAGIGLYLKGDGKGNFMSVMMNESGLHVPGEVKHIKKIQIKNHGNTIIFARNNENPKLINWDLNSM